MRAHPSATRRRQQGGFTLLEVVIAGAVGAIALVGHLVTVAGEHRLAGAQELRNEGLALGEQLIERLRSDEDWAGLYPRLRVLQDEVGPPVPGQMALDDGRMAYPPQAYFPDFRVPAGHLEAVVRIEVPAAALDAAPMGPKRLREDVVEPRFGLPADLNGDGEIDGQPHEADYVFLPVRVTWHLARPSGSPQTLTLATWIRGVR